MQPEFVRNGMGFLVRLNTVAHPIKADLRKCTASDLSRLQQVSKHYEQAHIGDASLEMLMIHM